MEQKNGKFWESNGDFLKTVWMAGNGSGKAREKMLVWKETTGHLEEGDGSFGGFTVPQQFRDNVMAVALEKSVVLSRAIVIDMVSKTVKIPSFVDEDHATSIFGGITVTWPGEAGALTIKNPTFQSINLQAKKAVGYVKISNELMEDASQAESVITRAFGEAIAYFADIEYISGNGSNRPLGILNAPCTIPVAIESQQAAATVIFENMIKMDSRLLPQSQRSAVWLINPDVKASLFKANLPVSSGGSIAFNLAGGPDGLWALGHEIIPTEKCETLGNVGDIYLADFGNYVVGNGGLQIDVSGEVDFVTDESTWRFGLRTDGQPILSSAITKLNGTDTVSPFITLATRDGT